MTDTTEHNEARNQAVRAFLDDNAARAGRTTTNQPRFFITFQGKYATAKHPVLGTIDVEAGAGLRADHMDHAVDWARHWLGTRGFEDVLDEVTFAESGDTWPAGCPTMHTAPPARYWEDGKGNRMVAWDETTVEAYDPPSASKGTIDVYDIDGRRKQTPAAVTLDKLVAGYGSWSEVWFSFDGERLSSEQVAEVCARAGVES